ncbi:hypothetical protein MAR_021971 [Mya arenaria]|uniref:Uncharacterized protein n=1 Tax=Mya arenaria TaxID=6604 RepID=A0ABY7ECC4_MYAAR|nr:hypothetical protein MAR_021971 [Mya arenaria]
MKANRKFTVFLRYCSSAVLLFWKDGMTAAQTEGFPAPPTLGEMTFPQSLHLPEIKGADKRLSTFAHFKTTRGLEGTNMVEIYDALHTETIE